MDRAQHADGLRDAEVFHKGDRIRKVREMIGYEEIQEFATDIGLDRGSLGKYEATGVVPRRGTLKAISMFTGARVQWLEDGTGAMFEPEGPRMRKGVTRLYRVPTPERQSHNTGAKISQFPTRTEETAEAA